MCVLFILRRHVDQKEFVSKPSTRPAELLARPEAQQLHQPQAVQFQRPFVSSSLGIFVIFFAFKTQVVAELFWWSHVLKKQENN